MKEMSLKHVVKEVRHLIPYMEKEMRTSIGTILVHINDFRSNL